MSEEEAWTFCLPPLLRGLNVLLAKGGVWQHHDVVAGCILKLFGEDLTYKGGCMILGCSSQMECEWVINRLKKEVTNSLPQHSLSSLENPVQAEHLNCNQGILRVE